VLSWAFTIKAPGGNPARTVWVAVDDKLQATIKARLLVDGVVTAKPLTDAAIRRLRGHRRRAKPPVHAR
jgi:hypothetical protein